MKGVPVYGGGWEPNLANVAVRRQEGSGTEKKGEHKSDFFEQETCGLRSDGSCPWGSR